MRKKWIECQRLVRIKGALAQEIQQQVSTTVNTAVAELCRSAVDLVADFPHAFCGISLLRLIISVMPVKSILTVMNGLLA